MWERLHKLFIGHSHNYIPVEKLTVMWNPENESCVRHYIYVSRCNVCGKIKQVKSVR